jgi:tRNA 2-selenouridine synthase
MSAMRASPCVRLALSLQHRVQLLLEDYTHFVVDADHFCERLERLVDLRGRATVEGWQAQVRAGQTPGVVAELLQQHYDPGYESSTGRNFAHYAKAPTLALPSPEAADMQRAAQQLVQLAQP